jgi:hypothetical protein
VIVLGVLGLFLLTVFVLSVIWVFNHEHQYEKAFVLLGVFIGFERVMLFYVAVYFL